MSLTADAILLLASKGFSIEEIADVARANAAVPAVKSKEDRKRELARERQARYADRKRSDAENVSGASEPRHYASDGANADAPERQECVSENTGNPAPLVPPSLSPRPPIPPPYNPPSPETPGADAGDLFGGSPPEPPADKPPRAAKTFPIPADWTPSPENRTYATQNGLTDEETDRAAIDFRDHFADRPSEKRPGWDRSWQRWVRTACDRKRERSGRMAGGAFAGTGKRGVVGLGEIIARRRTERGD